MSPLPDLQGKRVVVTGGSAGIGSAIVETARDLGARVAVIDVNDAPAAEECLQADVSSPDEAADAVGEAAARLRGLDVLVNNAGIAPGALAESTPATRPARRGRRGGVLPRLGRGQLHDRVRRRHHRRVRVAHGVSRATPVRPRRRTTTPTRSRP